MVNPRLSARSDIDIGSTLVAVESSRDDAALILRSWCSKTWLSQQLISPVSLNPIIGGGSRHAGFMKLILVPRFGSGIVWTSSER